MFAYRIPDDKSSLSGMSSVNDNVLKDGRSLLEAKIDEGGDGEAEKAAKKLYK